MNSRLTMEDNIKKLIKVILRIIGDKRTLTIFELGPRNCNNIEIFHNAYMGSKMRTFECSLGV